MFGVLLLMLAIVLTCDRYRALTEHMIHCYDHLWRHHPFRFRIPYQILEGRPCFNLQYVRTPSSIKETVLALLHDLDDQEWIYWCIDDKYPIALDLEHIQGTMDWLFHASDDPDVSGLLFCRCRSLLRSDNLTGNHLTDSQGNVLLERRAYHQIWIHQFLRVKVLRHLFQAFPDDITSAKAMDALLLQVPKPASHRIFVTKDNMAIFGESTSRGEITKNCHQSILQKKLVPGQWTLKPSSKEIIMGKLETPNERVPTRKPVRAGLTLTDAASVLRHVFARWRSNV